MRYFPRGISAQTRRNTFANGIPPELFIDAIGYRLRSVLQCGKLVRKLGKRSIKPARIEINVNQVEPMLVTPAVGVIVERQPGFDVVPVDVLPDLLQAGQLLPAFTIHAAAI